MQFWTKLGKFRVCCWIFLHKYNVNILGVKNGDEIEPLLSPDYRFEPDAHLIVAVAQSCQVQAHMGHEGGLAGAPLAGDNGDILAH